MKEDLNNLITILAYIENRLVGGELISFEFKIKNDAIFQQDVDLVKNLLVGISKNGDQALKNKLIQIEKKLEMEHFFQNSIDQDLMKGIEMHGTDSMKKSIKKIMDTNEHHTHKIISFPFLKWSAIAASFLVMIAIGWYLNANNSKADTSSSMVITKTDTTTNHTTVIESNSKEKETFSNIPDKTKKDIAPFVPKKDVITKERSKTDKMLALVDEEKIDFSNYNSTILRSNDANKSDRTLLSIQQLISEKKYNAALEILNTHQFENNESSKVIMMKAHAYWANKDYIHAKDLLEPLVLNGKTIYNDEASYLLLLCYMTNYDINSSKIDTLSTNILSDIDHTYYAKTKVLMDKASKIIE